MAAAGVLLGSVVAAFALYDGNETVLAGDPEEEEGAEAAPDGVDAPDEWDERVVDLVDFVERERGLDFEHPVQVDFLTEEEFLDEIRHDGNLDDEEREELEELQDVLPMLRALGLMEGDLDLFETIQDFQEHAVGAFYDDEEKRVVVPATDLTAYDEMVLVHELTHALQDQHFDLATLRPDDDDEAATGGRAMQALVEGDANRIDAAYVASLPASERDEIYDTEEALGVPEGTEEDEFPSFLVADLGVPYTLGQSMTQLIAVDGGNAAVDEAFSDPPLTGSHILDPRTFLEDRQFEELDHPDLPQGIDEPTDEGEFDALDVYFMLAQRIDFGRALEAADAWVGGSYAFYENPDDDRACARIALAGATDQETDLLFGAFDGWVEEGPEEGPEAAGATIDQDGSLIELETCDPGPEAELADDRLVDALTVAYLRSSSAWELEEYLQLDPDDAWDAADCIITDLLDRDFDFGGNWSEADGTLNTVVLTCTPL